MLQSYMDGGVVMHGIVVLAAVAAGVLVRAGALTRRGIRAGAGSAVLHLVAAIVLVGAFGTLDGIVQICAAVPSVAPTQQGLATLRGAALAVIPLGWATAIAAVLVLWHAVIHHREGQLVRARQGAG